ncbi:GTP:AMP phosphotransferase AK3, mitochondrial-like [Panonychus citri]|uniref:GTP:AMP phosphotransferase AK3, mitochondrial-like n=1 Tax=Panonychus citri TaxID=50023 RepID=UPI002307248C|nr:GTP:AMP phosphotransferase AK3, mitochondrial-like [Panonychus citri]
MRLTNSVLRNVRLVILGPPGSGKGTISQKLVSNFKLSYISCGDVLRNKIAQGTDEGKVAATYISRGDLVPNELVTKLMVDTINGDFKGNSWLMDGFPRTVLQAQSLLTCTTINKVINLNVPDDEIINRIKHRWIHLSSGRIYNLEYNPPKVPFKDDITGDDLIQREDDKPEAVKQRLDTYNASTLPVLEFFGKKGLLVEFTGRESNVLYPKIHSYLEDYLNLKSS